MNSQAQLRRLEAHKASDIESLQAENEELRAMVAEAQADAQSSRDHIAEQQQRLGQRLTAATAARDTAALRADASDRTSNDAHLRSRLEGARATLAVQTSAMVERARCSRSEQCPGCERALHVRVVCRCSRCLAS